MFSRDLESMLKEFARFPVVALLGPRQSGKTTLAQSAFKNYTYTSFEDPRTRELALADPERFFALHENEHGLIIDEFQHIPSILSYIQLAVDSKKRPGYFVLTGSQNFLMNQAISQSLAGRVGILTLLPLSIHELTENQLTNSDYDNIILNGCYPRIYAEHFTPLQLYPTYIQTYVERDVRQLTNVGDLTTFKKFLKLCAGRIGQQLNLSEIAGVCGISAPSAQRWLSILEASYIVFRLPPYFNNFNKRITQTHKLYFYDTGIACSLLGIESLDKLAIDPMRGHLFENLIIGDLHKQYLNSGKQPPLYYWRDKNGLLEVDCIIDEGRSLFPIEIKSATTVALDFFTNIKKWISLANTNAARLGSSYIVYGGKKTQAWDEWGAIGWQDSGTLIERIRNFTSNQT